MEKIRILSVELKNFKNIEAGIIEFGNYKNENIMDDSKIIGIYGPNGSGKTCVIEAIDFITTLIGYEGLPKDISEYISKSKDSMTIIISFYVEREGLNKEELLYFPEKEIFEYEVTIKNLKNNEFLEKIPNILKSELKTKSLENTLTSHFFRDTKFNQEIKEKIHIDEILRYREFKKNEWTRNKVLIKSIDGVVTTNTKSLLSTSNLKLYLELAKKERKSVIFSREFLNAALKNEKNIENTEIHSFLMKILYFRTIVKTSVYISDNKTSSIANCNIGISLSYATHITETITVCSRVMVDLYEPEFLQIEIIEKLEKYLSKANGVLNCLIPDLKIKIKKYEKEKSEDNVSQQKIELVSIRKNQEIPLRHESDGVKKIVSLLVNLIFVYNDPGYVLVIDEFDANLFEYLLGEIIHLIEEYGKGQLIFTSHNLRPLEVLDKSHLRFTTHDTKNRFIKIPNVKSTNNLRDLYMKNIFMNNEELKLYQSCSTSEIRRAFKKVGCFGDE